MRELEHANLKTKQYGRRKEMKECWRWKLMVGGEWGK